MKKITIAFMTFLLVSIPNYSFAFENNKQIQKTCLILKSKYSINTLNLWRTGSVSDETLIDELNTNSILIQNEIKKNKGSFKNNLIKLEKSQKYLKKSINEQSIQNIVSALSNNVSSFNKIIKTCSK